VHARSRETFLRMRHLLFPLAVVALFLGPIASRVASQGRANVVLWNAGTSLTQTSNTSWTLAKTGVVDPSTSSVTWSIVATPGTTVGGHLVVTGFIGVANFGTSPASIGNIVVNLQTLCGAHWVTQSSDIADATNGDAATSAHVAPYASSEKLALFTENAASGQLSFMDSKTNPLFSLVPAVTIPPFKVEQLLYSASFDNKVLNLPDGTAARIEVIVTFGNHPVVPPNLDDEDVDINGNGRIDRDEAKVRSVSTRAQTTIPATEAANSSVTLSDATSDLASTGTVTYSNPQFNLGPLAGTATVNYDPGTSGGSITNCAHATGSGITVTVGQFQFPLVAAFHTDACNTQTVHPLNCTPGTVGCGWHVGDMNSYGQTSWADPKLNFATASVAANFPAVYASTYGVLQVGIASGPAIYFAQSDAVEGFLPQSGPPAALAASFYNPSYYVPSSAGVFGGEVVALKINIDFSDAKVMPAKSSVPFGDLLLCGLTSTPSLNGITVRLFSDLDNASLGGWPVPFGYSIADLNALTQQLNSSFDNGTAGSFAKDHLGVGSCPATSWKQGDETTYTQAELGGSPSFLGDYFPTVYASTYGLFQIGTDSGFSTDFTDVSILLPFLPQSGPPAAFNANLLNPTSTAAGTFGGEDAALKLNIDFSDFGVTRGTSGLLFGDVRICGLTSTPSLNGMTIRQFSDLANASIGGLPIPDGYSITDLYNLTVQLNYSFFGGVPSTFAQQHLVNGSCQ